MKDKLKTPAMDYFFDAVLTLNSREECYNFFEDVCTIYELFTISQRLMVAKMLTEGKTYIEIAESTGASTATISRVNRSLTYGNDGYEMIMQRINTGSEAEK